MFNPFEMMQAPGGAGLQSFGRQVGLTPDQTLRAMEALLPALTIGLQHNAASDPMGFARLFGFGVPARATAAPAAELPFGGLFGSPAIAQAVIQQAASASGVGAQALRQMLPMMAGMIVAGIVHVMLNPPSVSGAAPAAATPPPPGFPANLWTDWLGGFPPPADPAPAKPVQARSARSAATQAPSPAKAAPAAPGADGPFTAMQEMFQTGADVHEQNVKAMRAIFATFWDQSPTTGAATAPEEPPRRTPRAPRG